jgi:outer membrane murein-binding lipoprotein Lpp
MKNLGMFTLGALVGASALTALACFCSDDDDKKSAFVSDDKLDDIIEDTQKQQSRNAELEEELNALYKENDAIAEDDPNAIKKLAKISKRQAEILNEMVDTAGS